MKRERLAKNIQLKKYHCVDKTELNRHLKSKMHTGNYKIYKCPYKDCEYSSTGKSHLIVHMGCRKHKNEEQLPIH